MKYCKWFEPSHFEREYLMISSTFYQIARSPRAAMHMIMIGYVWWLSMIMFSHVFVDICWHDSPSFSVEGHPDHSGYTRIADIEKYRETWSGFHMFSHSLYRYISLGVRITGILYNVYSTDDYVIGSESLLFSQILLQNSCTCLNPVPVYIRLIDTCMYMFLYCPLNMRVYMYIVCVYISLFIYNI